MSKPTNYSVDQDPATVPECPSCKFAGGLRWVPSRCYVECTNPDCYATFSTEPSVLVKATIEAFKS